MIVELEDGKRWGVRFHHLVRRLGAHVWMDAHGFDWPKEKLVKAPVLATPGLRTYFVPWLPAVERCTSCEIFAAEGERDVEWFATMTQNGPPDLVPTKHFVTTECGNVVAIARLAGDGAVGWAFCSHLDNYEKDRGRKLALRRALDALYPNAEHSSRSAVTKDARMKFWHAYILRGEKAADRGPAAPQAPPEQTPVAPAE